MKSNSIATRTLYDVTDPSRKFVIEIDAPKIVTDNNYWHCEIRVKGGPDGLDKMVAGGNDSYQALTAALAIVQAMVGRLNAEVLHGNLRFLEDDDTDLHLKVIQE